MGLHLIISSLITLPVYVSQEGFALVNLPLVPLSSYSLFLHHLFIGTPCKSTVGESCPGCRREAKGQGEKCGMHALVQPLFLCVWTGTSDSLVRDGIWPRWWDAATLTSSLPSHLSSPLLALQKPADMLCTAYGGAHVASNQRRPSVNRFEELRPSVQNPCKKMDPANNYWCHLRNRSTPVWALS